MAIAFDDTLITGLPELDRQHRELFVRLDALIEAIRRGSSRQEVGHTLAFLRQYVVTHFADEEVLMREVGFPGREEHTAEHAAFVRDLTALEAEHRRDGASPGLVVRVNVWLTSWLRTHIYDADRRIGSFVRGGPASS
ncbi:MAG TPA: hemerythrin family protein [Anaeromyxobacteraceae bacterium]|nr:hemerythrin family protein [Anaeromyxobacteraceae bacterium]